MRGPLPLDDPINSSLHRRMQWLSLHINIRPKRPFPIGKAVPIASFAA